jgi:hypothetical protein
VPAFGNDRVITANAASVIDRYRTISGGSGS